MARQAKAKESTQIEKARKKLKKQLDTAEKKFSADALAKMMLLNQKQLARHKGERVNLKNRQIVLFDENQHPAKTKSLFIKHLIVELVNQAEVKAKLPLEGRITSFSETEK